MSSRDAYSQVAGHRWVDKFVPETLAPSFLIWPPKEDPSPGKFLSLKHYLSTVYKTHIISWRWTRTGLGDSQSLHLDGRRPRSQALLQGLVPWAVTSLDNQRPSILKTLTLSRQGLCWRESSW